MAKKVRASSDSLGGWEDIVPQALPTPTSFMGTGISFEDWLKANPTYAKAYDDYLRGEEGAALDERAIRNVYASATDPNYKTPWGQMGAARNEYEFSKQWDGTGNTGPAATEAEGRYFQKDGKTYYRIGDSSPDFWYQNAAKGTGGGDPIYDPKWGHAIPAEIQRSADERIGKPKFLDKYGPMIAGGAMFAGPMMASMGLAGAGSAAGGLGESGFSAFGGGEMFGQSATGLMDFGAGTGIAGSTPGLSLGSLSLPSGISLAPGAGLTTLGGDIPASLMSGLDPSWGVNQRTGDVDMSGFANNSPNPLENIQNPLSQFDWGTPGSLGGTDFASNPLFTGGMSGTGPLALNPFGDSLFGAAANAGGGGTSWLNLAKHLGPQAAKALLGGGAGSDLLGGLGGGLGGILGQGADLAARLAPGLAALNFAKNQSSVDTSPLSKLLGGTTNNPMDTSRFSSLSDQTAALMNPYTSSVLGDYDRRQGQARGDLLSGLERRGVAGSSFGNMDVGNFDTMNGLQRGKLQGELGMAGINAQRGFAQDILGAQTGDRTFGLQQTNSQANIANQLLTSQLSQKAIQSALYGRAFDIMGRAVSPGVQLGGATGTPQNNLFSGLGGLVTSGLTGTVDWLGGLVKDNFGGANTVAGDPFANPFNIGFNDLPTWA